MGRKKKFIENLSTEEQTALKGGINMVQVQIPPVVKVFYYLTKVRCRKFLPFWNENWLYINGCKSGKMELVV